MEYFKVLKAPDRSAPISDSVKIFLAGSIDMGEAEDWQKTLTDNLNSIADDNEKAITIFNPRRDDWDSSWTQEINNTQFYDQVTWELDNIDKADIVVIFFSKDSKSPITLLELGKVSESKNTKILVCCPEGFYRKGNVDIVCYRKDIPVVESKDELLTLIKKYLKIKDNSQTDDSETPDTVKESVEEQLQEQNVTLTALFDNPTFDYTIGDTNTLVVEDFEYIENSCMMGKWKFNGREVIGGICNENGENKIKLKVRKAGEDNDRIIEFQLRKADSDSPEHIILSE